MRYLPAPALLLVLGSAAAAQDAPFHANLRDNLDQSNQVYGDVWGYGNYGFIGRWGDNEWDIIDVSNPDNVSVVSNPNVAFPNDDCSAQDLKVGPSAVNPSTTLAFVAFEYSSPDALGIYDVTNPGSPTLLTTVRPDPTLFESSHNVSYRDDGWLVIANSFSADASIIDLRSYDPSNPPASITSSTYLLSNVGSSFVHDITITDDYLFLAQWGSLIVYDVSQLGDRRAGLSG